MAGDADEKELQSRLISLLTWRINHLSTDTNEQQPSTEQQLSRGQKTIVGCGCLVGLAVVILIIVAICAPETNDSESSTPVPTAKPDSKSQPTVRPGNATISEIVQVQRDIERASDRIARLQALSDEWCVIFMEIDRLMLQYNRLLRRLSQEGLVNPDPAFELELDELYIQTDWNTFVIACSN